MARERPEGVTAAETALMPVAAVARCNSERLGNFVETASVTVASRE
jgi:hypothetical protein